LLVAEPAVVFHHHVACLLPVEVDWIERKVVSGMYQHTAYELAAPPAKLADYSQFLVGEPVPF